MYKNFNLGISLKELLFLSGKCISQDNISENFLSLGTLDSLSQIFLSSEAVMCIVGYLATAL